MTDKRDYRRRAEACVRLDQGEDRLVVSVHLDEMPLGLLIHSGERDRSLEKLFKQSGGELLARRRSCSFDLDQLLLARRFANRLRRELHRIAIMPLSPRQVERHLAISSAERVRWSKASWLPKSGTAQIRKGAKITLATYAAAGIEEVAAHPEWIARWRSDGAAQ